MRRAYQCWRTDKPLQTINTQGVQTANDELSLALPIITMGRYRCSPSPPFFGQRYPFRSGDGVASGAELKCIKAIDKSHCIVRYK
jgi:hypothetical protein